jgi:ATP-grasp domain, R2K clade family 2
LPQLAATTRALPMRQVLLALGFDERRLAPWRLEHKLVQALVFRHYCPDSLPPTVGLDRLAQGVNLGDLRNTLRVTFPRGFVIKTALGDCSGNECDYQTEAALSWIESGARYMPGAGTLTDEEFIVQERKNIRYEYRVHTIEDRVITDLTVYRHQGSVKSDERHGPNIYVQRILDALPAGITSGSNLGWDVALLDNGSFAVIEVNIGGIHTLYNPGFHASGFFHHHRFGAIYSARLLLFLERTYHCRIAVIADSPEYPEENYFYAEVADWKARF